MTAASARISNVVRVFAREDLNWRWQPHLLTLPPDGVYRRQAKLWAGSNAAGSNRSLIQVVHLHGSGQRPTCVLAVIAPIACPPLHSGFCRLAPPSKLHRRD